MGNCFACGTSFEEGKIHFSDSCEKCSESLHVCLNCDFHDRASANECREPSADPVNDKDRKNFCEFFVPRKGDVDAARDADALKNAAESLFKK